MKKVQGKKKRDAEAADAKKRLEDVEATARGQQSSEVPLDPEEIGGGDLLKDKDEDIIF